MKLLYFNICLWSLCILVCIFISFITLHKTNKTIHNLTNNCNKNKLSEHFEPYNGSYTNGFSINNVLCSDLSISKSLNTTADINIYDASQYSEMTDTNKTTTISSNGNITVKSIDNIKIQEETNKESKTLLQILYPVGSIYMSMNKTDPATFIGGTWILIQNRFLLSVPLSSSSKTEGGSDAITIDYLPSHAHSINLTSKYTDVKHKHNLLSYYDDFTLNPGTRSVINSDIMSIPDDRTDGGPKRYSRYTYTENTSIKHNHVIEGNTGTTGNSKSYKPPYITCYIWYKISDKINDEKALNDIIKTENTDKNDKAENNTKNKTENANKNINTHPIFSLFK